ncbi:sugar transferase [Algoriphagus chordae]|uniref:Sugar transferase n=1 Tax=Algoriphagus chordae TaxID=237019 RepID=A0A2W7R066_9BACT|nr:sugar transferase [Algoriphagus chordae]PZX54193.1 sugar transferase [Algoriphagus chordae]
MIDSINSNMTERDTLVFDKAGKAVLDLCSEYFDLDDPKVTVLSTGNYFNLEVLPHSDYQGILNLSRLNDSRRVNKFLEVLNRRLVFEGVFIGCVQTYANRRKRLISKYVFPLNYCVYYVDTFFHRILPKLKLTQRLYFYLTKGKGRMLSRAEMFGRLYSCGFEILKQVEANNKLYFVAKKISEPSFDLHPTYGPLIKLKRIGKNGEIFKVYKLRTMYPYAEYLQDYVYKNNELDEGGKFKDDFRVSPLGKFLRKFWIDELPMFWNLIKGDMKLIGVRPLSKHYFSLYTPEVQEMRTRVKPGLVPPFYADMPKTLDDIILSEKKYLELYEKAPFSTDVNYFFKIFSNILVKGARSK